MNIQLATTMIPKSFHALVLDIGQKAVDKALPGASAEALTNANTGFGILLTQVLNIVLTIGLIAVLFFLIMAGIEWITAGGDSGKIQKAREKITQGLIGLIVLISVVAIMVFIQQLLDICLIDFGTGCKAPVTTTLPGSCPAEATCVPATRCTDQTQHVGAACTGGVCCTTLN